MKRTFVVFSEFGELLPIADWLQNVEGQEVNFYVHSLEYKNIGKGIVNKIDNWYKCIGEKYVWVFDSCAFGELQDWLRSKGEIVFGGSEKGDELENNRQLAQKWFKSAGFVQPKSVNFKDIAQAIKFVEKNRDKKWVLKQNGDAPKSINHVGKFDGGEDMIFHLKELEKHWSESEYGKFDCDLMEFVEGMEVAASAFFNGQDFCRNKEGKVVGYLNFEEKKETDGGRGETTGETGTTFIGVTEDNKLFKDILLHPKIIEVLRISKFRGVFDINCIRSKYGNIVALEPTCRPGIPASDYEFLGGLNMPVGDMFYAVASGESIPIEIKQTTGMVICVTAKPYPLEADVPNESTSIGEKLWILNNKEIIKDFTEEQRKKIHLFNFSKEDDYYKIATKNGYLLTVTGEGKSVGEVRENVLEYIDKNLYIPNMKFRTDIGVRIEGSENKYEMLKSQYEAKLNKEKENYDKKISEVKNTIKDIIYND